MSVHEHLSLDDALLQDDVLLLLDRIRFFYGSLPAFADRNNAAPTGSRSSYAWREASYNESIAAIVSLAKYLINQHQLSPGDRCVLFSEARIEWPITFFGIWAAGGIVVPIDAKSTTEEICAFIEHIEPGSFCVSKALLPTAQSAMERIGWKGGIIVIDEDLERGAPYRNDSSILKLPGRSGQQTAVIAFTSATSGSPKAVEISVSNLFHQIRGIRATNDLSFNDCMLSVLPLHHLLELSCGLLTSFVNGMRTCYLNSILPHEIKESLKTQHITIMIVVPLLLEMMRKAVERNFEKELGRAGLPVLQLLQYASKRAGSKWLRRQMNRRILEELGPELRMMVVGGATLSADSVRFFENLGVNVWQGYGLTETSPVVSNNSAKFKKLGSVGRPLPGCEVRIARIDGEQVGEIMVRGPCVMKGYYRNPDLTRDVISQDGWFATGDLGYLDDGYLVIAGRKKNLVVLDGGKNVYPEEVEKVLSGSVHFQEVCVLGVTRPHPSLRDRVSEQVWAVVYPAEDLRDHSGEDTLEQLCADEVNRRSRELSAFKRPVNVVVAKEPLPKTRTGKVKVGQVRRELDETFTSR